MAQKKVPDVSPEARLDWIESDHAELSIVRQCELAQLSRATYYREPATESEENLLLMRSLDEIYLRSPFYGSRKLAIELGVNRKRVQRLMRIMGIEAIYAKPRLSQKHPDHRIFPYLLRNVEIVRRDQVWSTDITYVPMPKGFMYLTAIVDWFSRYVLAWELSNTLDVTFCLTALERSLKDSRPEIFNTDQGSQFTSNPFTDRLERAEVAISMDGRGRWLDNVFIERLWRSVKHESIYLYEFGTVDALWMGLKKYFEFYNQERIHESLGYRTPAEIYHESQKKTCRRKPK
jgi:putative transposase